MRPSEHEHDNILERRQHALHPRITLNLRAELLNAAPQLLELRLLGRLLVAHHDVFTIEPALRCRPCAQQLLDDLRALFDDFRGKFRLALVRVEVLELVGFPPCELYKRTSVNRSE